MQVPQPFGENLPLRLEPRTYGLGTTTREMTPPGGRIQRHLDAENPSRFMITDPRNNATVRQGGGGDREKQSRREEGRRRLGEKLAKVVSCGIPLDVCARVILTVGMLVSLLALLWSVNSLIQKRKPSGDFGVVLTVFQLSWGILLGSACLWGFLLMWGRWRRSPSAAHAFSIVWALVALLLFATTIVWFYCHFTLLSRQVSHCRGMTVAAGVNDNIGSDDEDEKINVPFRKAPKEMVDACIRKATRKARWVLVWGIIYAVMCYASIVIIVWARDYRRRLLRIVACEEAAAAMATMTATGEKVRLLLAPAPPGASRQKPRPKDTIVRISGTLAVNENQTSPPPVPVLNREAFAGGHNGLGISLDGQEFVGNTTVQPTQLR